MKKTVAALIALTASSAVSAVTLEVQWLGASGNWSNAAGWSTATVPIGTDDVSIDPLGSFSTTVSVNTAATVGNLTIGANDTVAINNNQSLTIDAGAGSATVSLGTNSTLALNSVGNATSLILSNGTVTFSGDGKVVLSNNAANRIVGSSSSDTLINQATIEGAGQIGADVTSISNSGTMRALFSNALTLDPISTGSFINTGTLEAASDGRLVFNAGTFNNLGGTIQALSGGKIEINNGATISNGSLSSVGSGTIENLGNGALDGVQIPDGTDLRVNNNTTLTLSNLMSNAGTIQVRSLGNITDIVVPTAGLTLSGGGVVAMLSSQARILGTDPSNLFINQDNTIRGAGQIGVDALTFDNRGIVEASNNGQTLTLDPGPTAFTNSGTYRATNGGILVLSNGSFDNTGGTIRSLFESTTRLTGATVTNGTLDIGLNGVLELDGSSFDNGTVTTAAGADLKTTGGASTLGGTVNIVNGASLTVGNNTSLTLLASSSYTLDGNLKLDSLGNVTDLIISGGNTTLTGNGVLHLDNSAANRVLGLSATDTLELIGVSVEGGGLLGNDSLGIRTDTTIEANNATNLVIDPSSAGLTNTGTLRANGGTLQLNNGTFTNTDGIIESLTGSTVSFSGATVSGGKLSGPGSLQSAGTNTFSGITIDPGTTLGINNNTAATFVGTLANQGTVKLNSIGNSTDFIVDSAGLTLNGGGDIWLNANSANRLYGASVSTPLTNADHTIHGVGQLGRDLLQISNQSIIAADIAGGTLTVDTSGTGLANTGTLRAVNGGTLQLNNSTIANTDGLIEALSDSTVSFSGSSVSGGTLNGLGQLNSVGGNTFSNIVINSGTTLALANNTSATFAGTLNNAGKVTLNSIGNSTDLLVDSAGLTLSGGGEILLVGNFANRVRASSGLPTLTNTDNTLHGIGQLGGNEVRIVNQGNIIADVSGSTLKVDAFGAGTNLTNTGVLRAINGAILEINGSTLANTDGTIEALSGSTVNLIGTSLTGGQLSGSGSFTASGSSTMNGFTLASGSSLNVPNNQSLTLAGIITNNGTISLSSVGNATNLLISSATATLNGSGALVLSNNSANAISALNVSSALTIGPDQTLRGGGTIGYGFLKLFNNGTIEADGTVPFNIDLGQDLANAGKLRASGTGGFNFSDNLSNTGEIDIGSGSKLDLGVRNLTQTDGHIAMGGGTLTADVITVSGGEFIGHGTVHGGVSIDNADLIPDGGTLAFTSTLTLGSGAFTLVEISGTNPGTGYGVITAPTINLDGTLYVRFGEGLETPISLSDSFTLLQASTALNGVFANVADGTRLMTFDGLGSFEVNYDALGVTLSAFQPIPEPSTWLLLISGGGLLFLAERRRRRQS